VIRREKRACRACAEGVSAAPLPERIIDKGLVSDRIVIDTIVNKYSDHRVPRTYFQQWRYGTV
jgi:transposase